MQNMFSNIMPGGGGGGGGGGGPNDDIPWWMKYAGKGAGIASGIIAMLFGVMAAIGISPICIVAGIWQVIAGFVVIVLEAPFCCMFIEVVQRFSVVIESRPPWQKALLYQGLCLPPIFMCTGLSTIIGGGAIFTTSIIYGVMALGKNLSIPPILMCFGLSTLVGSGSIFAVSIIYGMQVLGKKASKADMQAAAAPAEYVNDEQNILEGEQQYSNLYFIILQFSMLLYLHTAANVRASRQDMAAAAASGLSKSGSVESGLVGNIQGQDVEAAKLGQ